MTAPQEPLVTHLKRAGEQVLGAKGLTGNDHVRLSALLKVAALEVEALRVAEGVARDDAAELRAAVKAWVEADAACNMDEKLAAHGIGHDSANLERLGRAAAKLRAALAATEGQEA